MPVVHLYSHRAQARGSREWRIGAVCGRTWACDTCVPQVREVTCPACIALRATVPHAELYSLALPETFDD